MRDLVSAQFDPCVDFYDYVCGRWTGAPDRFSSFVADQRVYAKAATVAYMLQLLGKERSLSWSTQKARQDTVIASMASVYNGCVEHFATRKSLDSVADEVLHALNVRLETWRNSTLAGMLPRLVEFSLLYRLHSFFALTFERRSMPLRMTVGKVVRNISAAVYSLDKLYSYFETMVVALDKAVAARSELLRALVKLDGRVHEAIKMASTVETTLPLEQLDVEGVPHEMWASSVNRAFSLDSEASFATKIAVRSIGSIRDAFSAMVRTDSAVLSMYLLVLVTSQTIRYEFYERYAEVAQRVGWVHVSCTEVLSRLFPTHYANLEATALRGHVHNTSASELLEETRGYLMDSLNDSATIDAAAKDEIREQLSHIDVVFVEPVNVADFLGESDVEHTQSYIENMFIATRQEEVERALNKSRWPPHSRMLARKQWLGSFSYVEKLRAIVIASQNFLSAPQFPSYMSREVSNYAILRARFVRELLVALSQELTGTGICSPSIQDRVSFVSKSQAVEVFRQAESLRLAYQAYKQQKRLCYDVEESGLVAFDRNFFQVFCVQFCSHPLLEPTPSLVRMRDRCEISVRSMPEFWEAYKCPEEKGKLSSMRDCLVPR
ncbi:uncharacterized protein [Dermacentor andersoni]|uniref:uncharacterized protein n=1 Tax=Dermacentor andersoni TaxID=34620 RepID=UPI003B3ACA60